jgi:hypothetical protein
MTASISTILVVVLVSIGFVGFFFLGMSLTQIFKGHDIDSEISTNKDMQRLGIKCAVQESREDTGTHCADIGCHGNCSSCDVDHSVAK